MLPLGHQALFIFQFTATFPGQCVVEAHPRHCLQWNNYSLLANDGTIEVCHLVDAEVVVSLQSVHVVDTADPFEKVPVRPFQPDSDWLQQ